MFKSALIEGCGQNFNDSRHLFNVVRFSDHAHSSNIELLHLTGSSSLYSLILNFVRTQTLEKHLPWTLFTTGKSYSPRHGQTNSFDLLTLCSEKSRLIIDEESYDYEDDEAFLYKGKEYLAEIKSQLSEFTSSKEKITAYKLQNTNNIDVYLVDLLKLMIYTFDELNLPMRFCCSNPSELNSNESLRIQLQCYLPSEQRFITVNLAF